MRRTPSINTSCDNESLCDSLGLGPNHHEYNFSDVSEVALANPQREGGRDGTSLNVGSDIIGENPKHSGRGSHNAREVVNYFSLGEVF